MTQPQPGSDAAAEFGDRLASISMRARTSFARNVMTLEGAVAALAHGRLLDRERRDAERAAHQLAGAAGTFGFPEATPIARELEESFGSDVAPSAARRLAVRVSALRRTLLDGTVDDQVSHGPSRASVLAVHAGPRVASGVRDAARARGLNVTSDPFTEGLEAAIVDLRQPQALALVRGYANRVPPVPVVALGDTASLPDRLTASTAGASLVVTRDQPLAALIDTAISLAERQRQRRSRILAVDDDEAMLDAISTLLDGEGYEVSTLADARGFVAALEQASPDLVLLDLDMPHADGAELCRVLRTDPRWSAVPVVFLTAGVDSEHIERVFAAGADDYVSKPVSRSALRARIGNRLERVQLFRALAETDPLTGLANRRRLEDEFGRLRQLAPRLDQPLSLVLLDLDRFKRVNDEHGHSAGDVVIRRLATHVVQAFRSEDVVARWGGEELVVLALGMSRTVAVHRMRDILEAFMATPIEVHEGVSLRVSFSAGVAELGEDGSDLRSLIRSADAALYRAKHAGRARVAGAGDLEPAPPHPGTTPARTGGEVHAYYRGLSEAERLDATGHGRLEQLRTKELLAARLPPPPARILDVGGGTGVYARWLADLGYEVHLVDVVPEHIDQAIAGPTLLTAAVGDARHLDEPDQSADAVLLLGPLYHLLEHDERMAALREARRALRPGGLLAAAVISRHAGLIAAATRGDLDLWQRDLALSTLRTGRHDPRLGFTSAYFHTAEEAVSECREAGFSDVSVHAVEGPMWAAIKTCSDPSRLRDLLESAVVCARAIQQDPALLAASAHLLVIGLAPD